ncbi:MAG: RNA 2',3'-cyclic phosphodiesterase [Pseudomonadota bacterium]
MKRAFLALPIPDDIAEALRPLQAGIPGARWQSRDNMHITLNFLGNAEEPDLEVLHEILQDIELEAFPVTVRGVGSFEIGKYKEPKILWAGVEKSEALQHLKKKTDQAVKRAGLDIEHKRFTPHITLARMNKAPLNKVAGFIEQHNLLHLPRFTADKFTMYESHLGEKGAIYTPLIDYPLQK